ncbi:hypothetical protein ACH50O_01430 [Methylomonas sp. 2BW1-5-20]|uniref:hypothetical protein n=1 Tax=Methylomonas sp. 2BW1-5-20 TaxID=3376686 RepID=UPI00404CD096
MKSLASIHAANLGLALAVIDAFAAGKIDVSAYGLQRILLEPSVPTNPDAVRVARPTGKPLTFEQIDALVARLNSTPFNAGGDL